MMNDRPKYSAIWHEPFLKGEGEPDAPIDNLKPVLRGRALIRQMMDEGKTRAEMIEASGLSEKTVVNYQYAVRREHEIVTPNGRPVHKVNGHVRLILRCHFTSEQAERLESTAVRYGFGRSAVLIEELVAAIVRDDLFRAVLDPDEEAAT